MPGRSGAAEGEEGDIPYAADNQEDNLNSTGNAGGP